MAKIRTGRQTVFLVIRCGFFSSALEIAVPGSGSLQPALVFPGFTGGRNVKFPSRVLRQQVVRNNYPFLPFRYICLIIYGAGCFSLLGLFSSDFLADTWQASVDNNCVCVVIMFSIGSQAICLVRPHNYWPSGQVHEKWKRCASLEEAWLLHGFQGTVLWCEIF